MKFIDIVRMAFGNLKRNKMRTVLTVSGVVVGIGAIVFLVSLGYGLQRLATSKVANLGALTVITVRPGNKQETTITDDTLAKFKSFGEVSDISPTLSYPSQINEKSGSSDTIIYGIIPKYFDLEDVKIDTGGKFSSDDAKEVIISNPSLKGLNLGDDKDQIIGKTLTFNLIDIDSVSGNLAQKKEPLKLKIVAITNEPKVKYAYVPLNIIKQYGSKNYSQVKIKVAQRQQVSPTRKAIESMGYPTSSVKDQVDQIDKAFVVIRGVLGGFGMIALFVAAIGIFNTMTISLLERTHEIGIMKAIGGRNKDISRMFTMESAIIGFIGGILGVFFGWLLGISLNGLANFIAKSVGGQAAGYFYTPYEFAFVVIGFSFLVSTIAGIWPARRASKLNPLEALRYE